MYKRQLPLVTTPHSKNEPGIVAAMQLNRVEGHRMNVKQDLSLIHI